MANSCRVPFNHPYMSGREIEYISQAHADGHLSGDGPFTKRCHRWLEEAIGAKKALLTHSCTAALEMAALLINIVDGDEIIMPSYTFVSTANAFVLRGGRPVFVDIRPDTMNIDEEKIECAITGRTRAICVVHYAGVACELNRIMDIAEKHGLLVIEDAAQGVGSAYEGKQLGSIGALAALSFHETKNVICGEGGALLVNRPLLLERSEIIREKGTNRSRFMRGQVDKYTWVDVGSSYLPGEIAAAFLAAQCEQAHYITARRLRIWHEYHAWANKWETAGIIKRPFIPENCQHNAHMYYIVLRSLEERTAFIEHMQESGIMTVFHYVPLHSSPAGLQYGRTVGDMQQTIRAGDCLVRLPLWLGVEEHLPYIMERADAFFQDIVGET
jgi:dTDP-4-amino-4,6-dideoxygalactose transaminase